MMGMLVRSLSMLVAMLATTALAAGQQGSKPPATKILFVCEHGAAKSVIAAKELEKMAREGGISIQAVTRGTTPDPEIPMAVRTGLKTDGIDIGAMKPVLVKPEDLRSADRVISFGPDLSAVGGKTVKVEDWSATPDVSANFPAARDYIVKRLQTLLDEIAAPKRQ